MVWSKQMNPKVGMFRWILESCDERGHIIEREETYRVTVADGWECGHAVWTPEEAEDRAQEQGVDPATGDLSDVTCEWCESINAQLDALAAAGTRTQVERYDPRLRPTGYIECEMCDGDRIPLSRAVKHLTGGHP